MKNCCRFSIVVFAVLLLAPAVAAEINESGRLEEGLSRSGSLMGAFEPQNVFVLDNLVGRSVVDRQNQQLGTVRNVVIGPDGRVSYLILSPAQGMRNLDQLVAVPWNAANPSMEQNRLVMDLSRSQIENSPRLPSADLAQLQNPQMQQRINAYFGPQGAQPDVQAPRGIGGYESGMRQRYGEESGGFMQPPDALGQAQGDYARVDRLIGESVMDELGRRLGTVEDALISQDGQIRYLVIGRGAVAGQSAQLTVVPWSAAQPSFQANRVIIGMRRETFESAPHLPQDQLDRLQNPEFQQSLFGYYGGPSAAIPTFPTRANEIIGEVVVNPQGEELGTVRDLVTTEAGCVKFLLLSPSEQLGMADQLVALPWTLIRPGQRQNAVVMNISRQELLNAPAFSRQNWRDYVNNPQFDQRVYSYFQAQPGSVPAGTAQPRADLGVVRATRLIGITVADQDAQTLGTLRDLVSDENGKIRYLLISTENDPSKIVAVPWDIADPGIEQNTLIIGVSRDSFSSAPTFSMNDWQRLKNQQWENRVNNYFQYQRQGERIIEIF